MLTSTPSIRRTALLLMLSLSACYIALSPGTVQGRGYVPDDLNAGMGLLASFNAWVKGRPIPPIVWTRHGPLPLLFDLPFIKLGKLFVTPDFFMSLQSALLTAALLTILYVWLRKLCTAGMSLILTLIGAFATMLWPYAYIGLETKQSFFVFLAGYLALACGKIRTWPRLVLFSMVCGVAISTKSTGIVLLPPMAYLVYVQFKGEWRSQWKKAVTSGAIIMGIWALAALGWSIFWRPAGGGTEALKLWMTHSPFQIFTNAIGIFGSSQKGFFVFAPALLFCFYAIPRVINTHREPVFFGLLVTASIVGLLSILIVTADELWGPRFLHVAVAPLLVIIGAACPRFYWRRDVVLLLLGAIGLAISFLGSFAYYGTRPFAAATAAQNTMEWLAGDSTWNEVEFDARVFRVWWKGSNEPVPWTPTHVWAWSPPPGAMAWKTLNLRDYSDPQSFLLYYWKMPLDGSNLTIFRVCWISLLVGPLLLLWVIGRTLRSPRDESMVPEGLWRSRGAPSSEVE